jgi:hypothetical protein
VERERFGARSRSARRGGAGGAPAGRHERRPVLPGGDCAAGRFAAFLQAEHKDREKLLKQLFASVASSRSSGGSPSGLPSRRATGRGRARLATVAARVASSRRRAARRLEADPGWPTAWRRER